MSAHSMIKFGTDGWRGVIGDDFTFANVRIVSQAIADFLKRRAGKHYRVVVGYDCRFLSDAFAKEVGCVLAANGIKTALSSTDVPTPAISFHCLYNRYDLGIMITASHNPAQFNGRKIKTRKGGAADQSLTDDVEKLLGRHRVKAMSFEEARKRGVLKIEELAGDYTRFLKNFFTIRAIKRLRLRILVDLMYGTSSHYLGAIAQSPSLRIEYLHDEFNPSFGGVHPEPIAKNLQELILKVRRGRYDLGIAIDGDGDRVAAVTKKGDFIDAQVLLPLLALHVAKNRKERRGIGKTLVGSNLIDEVSLSLGVPCYETPVGFKYISNLFKEKLISIGGEEAGGIGFDGYIPERDGTASSLMLLEMMAYEGKSFDALLAHLWKKYGRWYYMRTAVEVRRLRGSFASITLPHALLGKKIERVNRSDGIKLSTKNSWLMFRKSGTEPIVRIYAEAKSRKEAGALIDLGEKTIRSL